MGGGDRMNNIIIMIINIPKFRKEVKTDGKKELSDARSFKTWRLGRQKGIQRRRSFHNEIRA